MFTIKIFYLSVLKVVVELDCSIRADRTAMKTDKISNKKNDIVIKNIANCI